MRGVTPTQSWLHLGLQHLEGALDDAPPLRLVQAERVCDRRAAHDPVGAVVVAMVGSEVTNTVGTPARSVSFALY